MIDKRRARLRPDERAAGRAPARRPLRPDDGGVLPRRGPGRPPLHRQHLPLRRRRAPRCRRSSAACRAPSATSRRSRPRWASSRSGSPRREPARSRRCRRSTCPPTTSPTRRRRTRSPTSTRTIVLSRAIVEQGIYPGRRPARLDLPRAPARHRRRSEHYETATRVQEVLQRYKDLQDIIAILGMDELSDEDKLDRAARAQDRALPLAADLRRRAVHRHARPVRPARGHDQGFREILDGKHDDLPEQAFYMVGTIEEARSRRRRDEAAAA